MSIPPFVPPPRFPKGPMKEDSFREAIEETDSMLKKIVVYCFCAWVTGFVSLGSILAIIRWLTK